MDSRLRENDMSALNSELGMTTLLEEIDAYDRMRDVLETQYLGKWVVIKDGELRAYCDTFGAAARDAMRKYGRGPYLIRRVGAPPISLPASLAYGSINGDS